MPNSDGTTAPRPEELDGLFHVSRVTVDGETVHYHGESYLPKRELVAELGPTFDAAGYDVSFTRRQDGGAVLTAQPYGTDDGVPWTNVVMFLATVATTLFVGATAWYYVPPSALADDPLSVLQAWPFTAAVLGVLMTHELGHYVAAKYYGVEVSLPYVIPFFALFGTMGAVIRMRGRMPDRRALFDIGAAGPIAGLVATVVVTAVGLSLDPMQVPQRVVESSGATIYFNDPPLLTFIANLLGEQTAYESRRLTVHPVIIGGWVGMFFTVLNLLPVGQLDGGHITRAMFGRRQETLASLVPLVLFGLSGYLYFVRDLGFQDSVGLWAFWGLLSAVVAFGGAAEPLDETPLGPARYALGVFTFVLGAACFVLVPISVQMA